MPLIDSKIIPETVTMNAKPDEILQIMALL